MGFKFGDKDYSIAALFEHDPFVEINPDFQKKLEELGFKAAIIKADNPEDWNEEHHDLLRDEDEIVAWYHPDHWDVYYMTDSNRPKRIGDTWLFDWDFYAKTDEAREVLLNADKE